MQAIKAKMSVIARSVNQRKKLRLLRVPICGSIFSTSKVRNRVGNIINKRRSNRWPPRFCPWMN